MHNKHIPKHLMPFIAEQEPSLYTAIDHASWRYILRVSKAFFKTHAHQKYLDGLVETGISTESIPRIEDMSQSLEKFGWRAVAVVGFIPPAAFMEFLSLGLLPIACDMRRLEHLSYTPAPDIVHEAAGHAPIIADPQYAAYLHSYGEIARKVIFSDQDLKLYQAIRKLSDIKEDPKTPPAKIEATQKHLDEVYKSLDYVSEANALSRMAWWTFEYGLVGELSNPKIYGAGLLSSVSESYNCLGPTVKKVPFSLECIEMPYDITKPQPQLYVAKDFPTLTQVLNQLADTMAYRLGGMAGLKKAQRAKTTTTTVFDSGIQISGILTDIITNSQENPCYLRYSGPVQLAYQDAELKGQGPDYHKQGFGTPVGLLKNSKKSPTDLTDTDLEKMTSNQRTTLEFESGVIVQGVLKNKVCKGGKNLILVFDACEVKLKDQTLFSPDWGMFDMACGKSIPSVFGGSADREKYLEKTGGFEQEPKSQKTNLTPENKELNKLYARVRHLREATKKEGTSNLKEELVKINQELDRHYPNDWLLRLEILELHQGHPLNTDLPDKIKSKLKIISQSSEDKKNMITRGLELV